MQPNTTRSESGRPRRASQEPVKPTDRFVPSGKECAPNSMTAIIGGKSYRTFPFVLSSSPAAGTPRRKEARLYERTFPSISLPCGGGEVTERSFLAWPSQPTNRYLATRLFLLVTHRFNPLSPFSSSPISSHPLWQTLFCRLVRRRRAFLGLLSKFPIFFFIFCLHSFYPASCVSSRLVG